MNINIPKDLKENNAIVYAYIKAMSYLPYEDDIAYIYTPAICAVIGNSSKHTHHKINEAIEFLSKNKYIECEQISRAFYKVNRNALNNLTPPWVSVPFKKLHKIIKETGSWNLAWYYILLLGTINTNSMVGSYGIDKLCELSELNRKTVISYNKKLEDLGVIFIMHNPLNDGKANKYGLPENESAIRKAAAYRPAANNANFHRRVSAKYNQYVRDNGEWWSAAQVEELLRMCRQYNEDMDALQSTQPGSDYINRKKDLSVFGLTMQY